MRRIVVSFSSLLFLGPAACGDDGGGVTPQGDVTTQSDATTSTSNNDATATATSTTTTATDAATTTSNDTATSTDSTTTDTTDNGEHLCLGILSCVGSSCASATTQEQFTACVQTCSTGAQTAEVQAFAAYAQCEADCIPEGVTGQPTPAQEKEIYQCLLDTCVNSSATCQGGADFGTKTCLQLNACLTACGEDGTPRCLRDCFAESTQEAGQTFVSLNFCVLAQCIDKSGSEFTTCATAAQQNPPCQTYVNQCRGGAGGASGAGGGGGAGSGFFPAESFRAMHGR